MRTRRQPSEAFLQRLKAFGKVEPEATSDPPPSLIRRFRNCDYWLWAEAIAFVVVMATLWQIWIDLEDRQLQRIAQAWETVTRAAPGNSGKVPALEYLNSQGNRLVGIDLSIKSNGGRSYLHTLRLPGANLSSADLSGADLYGANLSGAMLSKANLSEALLPNANLSGANLTYANLSEALLIEADLSGATLCSAVDFSAATTFCGADLPVATLCGANLSGAFLRNASLSDAILIEANLSGALLSNADLSGANLSNANLSKAILKRADLSGATLCGADLSGAKNLLQLQLETACGNEETQLPKGLSIKICP